MDMISIKSPSEIEKMRAAGRLTAQARALAGSLVKPGISTLEIDREVRKFIESHGAKPSFLGYGGFPGSACISINEVVIHGIPDHRKLKEGDIVSVDVGAYLDGFHGDCAATFPCGEVSDEAGKLIEVTRQSFFEGIKFAKVGQRVSDIGHAVQQYVESFGTLWATAWAASSTRRRRSPTMGPPDMAPGSCRVWSSLWSPWCAPATGG